MFERGVQKGWGLGVLPQEKKNQSFKFEWSIWPILAEKKAKSGKYIFIFFANKGGGISPSVVLRGGPDPLPPP